MPDLQFTVRNNIVHYPGNMSTDNSDNTTKHLCLMRIGVYVFSWDTIFAYVLVGGVASLCT